MAQTAFKGMPVNTNSALPAPGSQAPDFNLVGKDLGTMSLANFSGKKVVLNIFPSIDTPVCAASVRHFNQDAASLQNTVVLCISRDLPFAQARFCGAEGLERVVTLSEFRDFDFSTAYGVKMVDGPLAGLTARSVFVLDAAHKVVYHELVDDITHEPNYQAALAALK